ncbi:hypothetical protein [Streptomyces sp. 4F14]
MSADLNGRFGWGKMVDRVGMGLSVAARKVVEEPSRESESP